MDVLPAIPDTETLSDTAIELTDKQLRLWQQSDPQAYITWFRARCAPQFLAERKALAASAGGTVEDVPAWRVRTPCTGSCRSSSGTATSCSPPTPTTSPV